MKEKESKKYTDIKGEEEWDKTTDTQTTHIHIGNPIMSW